MKRIAFNYLYFGAFFALLVILSASSIFIKEDLAGSRIFFFLYAVGQVILETAALIFLGWVIERFLGRICFFAFIGATFAIFILHGIDFLMDRLLELSAIEVLDLFVFKESVENFLFLLDASGVPVWAWAVIFSALAALPLLGIVLYRMTERVVAFRPVAARPEWFLQTFFCLPAALLFWDFSASRVIHPDAYTSFVQSLPWKFTLLRPETVVWPVTGTFRKPLSEQEMAKKIAADTNVLEKRPNIYLFVVESLRGDSITPQGAPHLHRFREVAVQADLTLSNANASAISWFSIFHSQFPCSWNWLRNKGWEMGSPPLNLLKKWGYKIHLYSSAQLGFYGMEKLLFGKEKKLLDSYKMFHHAPPLSAAETDAAALQQLKEDLAQDPSLHEGQVFIIFWDATHFDYSWPKNWSPKFTPFAAPLAYFKAFYSKNTIELIKNRYRNAVHYMDSLFGEFLQALPRSEEAIVLFTGDHGEEFFEKGHLFHGSHLVQEQTQVPIFMKFGSMAPLKVKGTISQMDLFPSVLHHLSGKVVPYLEGQSIFSEKRWPYAMVSRFNAGLSPYEFCLHNGKHKLIARFTDRRNIFQSASLQIRSIKSAGDQTIPECKKDCNKWIKKEFGEAFDHLFNLFEYTSLP